jgi:hypothetical protein
MHLVVASSLIFNNTLLEMDVFFTWRAAA